MANPTPCSSGSITSPHSWHLAVEDMGRLQASSIPETLGRSDTRPGFWWESDTTGADLEHQTSLVAVLLRRLRIPFPECTSSEIEADDSTIPRVADTSEHSKVT